MAIELADDVLRLDRLYIGGEWRLPEDGAQIESIDPSTGRVWAVVAAGGKHDVDLAVAAARQALEGPWAQMPGHERAALLRRFADLYAARAQQLAEMEARDSGRAIREARADIGSHHFGYHWWASLADKASGRTIPFDNTVHAFTSRVPVGVVAAITPWNVPLMAAAWKLGPALAAGCTVVIKPAEQTPVGTLELGKLFEEAGFPPGVVNIVPGHGADDVGEWLVSHPGVDKIAFTGEGATAKAILRKGAETMKRFTFELGGKSPHIIFADADLEQAINAATNSAWTLCGQSCALGSRVLVQKSVYEKVAEAFRQRALNVRVGPAINPHTHMGPQAHLGQLEKTLSYIAIGQSEGADLLTGGKQLSGGDFGDGYFIQPTVFANVSNDMKIAQDEIFGPVAALIPFDDEDDAVRIANDTRYGLTAGLWTGDTGRAHRVASRIRAGMVWVNTYRFIRWSTPYGGFGASGWGRENGVEALDGYLETRTTVVSTHGRFPDAYAD